MRDTNLSLILAVVLLLMTFYLIYRPVSVYFYAGAPVYPYIKPGDLIIGISTKLTGLQAGDIVMSYNNSGVRLQRITRIIGSTVVLSGINDEGASNGTEPASDVLYKVVAILPRDVWIPSVFIILAMIGGLLIPAERYYNLLVGIAVIIIFLFLLALSIIYDARIMSAVPSSIILEPTHVATIKVVGYNSTTHSLILNIENAGLIGNVSCFSNSVALPCYFNNSTIVANLNNATDVIAVVVRYNTPYNVTQTFYIVARR